VFSGALLGSILAGLSGGVGPFVIVVTTIGILGIGRVISEFARRYSGTGTVYEFIARSLGKRAAVFAAGIYHLAATALAGPGIAVIGGLLARDFFGSHMGIHWAWWVWALIVAVIILAVNVVGIQISVKAQLSLIVISVVPFLILFVKVLFDGGPSGNSLQGFNPGHVATGGSVFKGILFAILMFVGFELSAALGEETKDPKKSIPRAVLATIGIVAVFYVLTQYTFNIGFIDGNTTPDFATLGEHYLNHFFGVWIELAVLLDVIAVGIGFQLAAARGVFSLARDRVLPHALARTNGKQLPILGSATVFVVTVVSTLVMLAVWGTGLVDPTGPDLFFNTKIFNGGFLGSTVIGGMLICFIYLLVCVGAMKLFATKNLLDLGGALLGAAACVLGIVSQFVSGTEPVATAEWGKWYGIIIVGLVAVWALLARKSAVDQVAQHAMEHV
jgi:amino acid transporter